MTQQQTVIFFSPHLFFVFPPLPQRHRSAGRGPTVLGPVKNGEQVSHVEDDGWGCDEMPSKCPYIAKSTTWFCTYLPPG